MVILKLCMEQSMSNALQLIGVNPYSYSLSDIIIKVVKHIKEYNLQHDKFLKCDDVLTHVLRRHELAMIEIPLTVRQIYFDGKRAS